MAKQLICPLAFNRNQNTMCLEENCAFWVKKGVMETKENPEKTIRVHEPIGACAVRVIAERRV